MSFPKQKQLTTVSITYSLRVNYHFKSTIMKSLKKLMSLALVAIFSFGVAKAQMGVQLGFSSSSQKEAFPIPGSMIGFHVGPSYEMQIQGAISLQYALLYNYLTTTSGMSQLPSIATLGAIYFEDYDQKSTAHRLDLPVRVAGTFPINHSLSFFVFAGPNFNFGLTHKIYGNNIYTDDDLSRFDLQLGTGAGLKYNNFALKAGYDWGMLNRIKGDGMVWRNNDLKVSLAVAF